MTGDEVYGGNAQLRTTLEERRDRLRAWRRLQRRDRRRCGPHRADTLAAKLPNGPGRSSPPVPAPKDRTRLGLADITNHRPGHRHLLPSRRNRRTGEIGATDGLPTETRNDANCTALGQELNLLQEGNLREGYPGEDMGAVNKRLQNAQMLSDRLEASDSAPKGKELYLLNYDSKDDGKAVIAMGNPDRADHTGIQVPGTNTTMESVPGQLERIGRLQNAAQDHAEEDEDVATVIWLGYDAPEAGSSKLSGAEVSASPSGGDAACS